MTCVRDPAPQPPPRRRGGVSGAPTIRPGTNSDADGFIALISACWSEYPGIKIDIDAEAPELRALASHYTGKGGALWAADADGRIVGMIGVVPQSDGAWEIFRLYLLPPYRGTDLAPRLLAVAEAHARAAGATRRAVGDTRFDRATGLQPAMCDTARSACCDISNSLEFGYINRSRHHALDAASAASAGRGGLWTSCVRAS
jgi:GNAT superfamily N-acetyltransferase